MMDFQTPIPVCHHMVDLLPLGVQTVLEPTPGEGILAGVLRERVYDVTAPVDFWSVSDKFDAVVMNPPFTPMEQGYKILYAVMEMTDVIIALMPWLTIVNSERRTKLVKSYGLRSVTHLPRGIFKGSRVQTCILEMRKGYEDYTALFFYSE